MRGKMEKIKCKICKAVLIPGQPLYKPGKSPEEVLRMFGERQGWVKTMRGWVCRACWCEE